MYFSFLLWASTSAAIQPDLSSSNVSCVIAIVAIVSFEQINQSKPSSSEAVRSKVPEGSPGGRSETTGVGLDVEQVLLR